MTTFLTVCYTYTAPTGSGKTVLMELAIIRVLLNYGSNSKIIYMAPTKSLCSERVKDWEAKFGSFGIKCEYICTLHCATNLKHFAYAGKEFTGDTNFTSVSSIQNTTIM